MNQNPLTRTIPVLVSLVALNVADHLGLVWWRLFWLAFMLWTFSGVVFVWRRGLRRTAVGMGLVSCAVGSLGLTANRAAASAFLDDHWIWFVSLIGVMLALMVWDHRRGAWPGQSSPRG